MAETGKVLRDTDADAIRMARTLMRTARYGALATLKPGTGAPAASRVACATDMDGAPLILVSSLSAHTGALLADPRCSLLVGEPGKGDPLAYPRISLACKAARLEAETPEQFRAERRYLNRHPKAALYAGFADFAFFRLEPQNASLNGGFGRAYRLVRTELITAGPLDELAALEQSAIEHMNADHRDAIALCAAHFAKAPASDWRLTGIDPDGVDLAAGDAVARVWFPEPLARAGDLRALLAAMARQARAAAR